MWTKLWKRLANEPTVIRVLPDALEADERRILWTDVQSILAYKIDAYTVDQIRLGILVRGADPLEITESDEGYQELVDALPEKLPGCESMGEWFFSVAFPAFERCERVIYVRTI